MKNKIILFTSFLLILIIILMPAKLIKKFIPEKSGFRLVGLDGTVWSGSIDHLQGKGWTLSEVKFNTKILALVTGQLGADISILEGDLKGDLSFSLKDDKNVELEDVSIKTQFSHFEKYIPFKGIELNGSIETQNLDLKLVDSKPNYLAGITQWNDGAVVFNGKSWQLGNFAINWQTNEDGSINGTIMKEKNVLDIQGNINISNQGLLDFSGSISTGVDKSMFNAFLFFADGKPSDGRQELKFKKKIW
ncbi:MAG: hypothetical protein COB38_09105 [Gammaproteobacteria bacterium]|nr:MAG: hypothetical protein COB38_09105 [Gammaproteobacteria bacterium]